MQEKEIRLDLGLITMQGPNIDVNQLKFKKFASLCCSFLVSKYSLGAIDQKRIEYNVRMTAKVTTQGPYLMVAKKMLNISNLGVTTKNITGPTTR